jgi:hypothetical protein
MVPGSIATYGADLVDAHEARHAVLAAGLSGVSKIEEHAWGTVNPVAGDQRCADQAEESRVLLGSRRDRVTQPSVVPAGSNLKESAQRLYLVLPAVCFGERIDAADLPNADLVGIGLPPFPGRR